MVELGFEKALRKFAAHYGRRKIFGNSLLART